MADPIQSNVVLPAVDPLLQSLIGSIDKLTPEIQTFVMLTALSFIPIFLIAMTAFTRILIVLSLLRQALGLQQTPPNLVLMTLALFLTFYTMGPVFNEAITQGWQPFTSGKLNAAEALTSALEPFKLFMIHQTREEDFMAIASMSGQPLPLTPDEVRISQLIPAFLLSELTVAFKMAFVIFIPFLLIDLVVSSVLMALGMMMVPPITVSLPLKIMLFVLINGWSLVSSSLVSSFQ